MLIVRVLLVVAGLLCGALMGGAVAHANPPIDCPPGTTPSKGRCVITVTDPVDPKPPVVVPIGGGGGGGGTQTCSFMGVEIPCSSPQYGSWDGSCYVRLADPQPPMGSPVWGDRTDGVIVSCALPSCVVPSIGFGVCDVFHSWSASPPGGGPTPRQLAEQAIAAMNFRAGQIGITPLPGPDSLALVGLPTWMWVEDPDEHTVGPITRSASAGGITVTATGTLDRIVWSMGDGNTVTCAGAKARGTRYEPHHGAGSSPTCGYTYTQTSASKPGQAFTVTATSHWTVQWSGGGQSGTIPLTFSRSLPHRVGEVQAIITG